VSGATGYLVDELENGVWTQVGSAGSGSTTYTVNGLSPNTTYSFSVGASDAAGTTWANSRSAPTFQNNLVVNHPAASYSYSAVTGTLFGKTGQPSYLDVKQGVEGDCWLISSLAEVAARERSDIVNMFTYEGTAMENGSLVGLYKVRFFNSFGTAQYVTVDTELPAGGTEYDQPLNGVFWVALAEKAYAEANGEGIVTTFSPGIDSYDALGNLNKDEGGLPSWALQAITGKFAKDDPPINPSMIAAAWNAGQLIVLGTSENAVFPYEPDHAYAMVGYNASSTQPFEFYNPWGPAPSGTPQGQPNVYGTQYASATEVSQNFLYQSIGTGAAAGLADHGSASQEVAVLLVGLDHQWLKHSR